MSSPTPRLVPTTSTLTAASGPAPTSTTATTVLITSLAIALICAASSTAHADKRGVLRIGVTTLQLTPAADTPVLGDQVDEAVEAYNLAAAAYNQAHGYGDGSAQATAPIDRGALGVRSTLLTIAPGIEGGARNIYVRLEAQLGLGETHRAYGLAFYPFNLAGSLRDGQVVPYLSAGGSVSWLDDRAIDGEMGALLAARVAVGVRLAQRMTIEVGYGVATLGGVVDRGQLETMSTYDPSGAAPPPHPDAALSGGEQQGMIDVSIGLAL